MRVNRAMQFVPNATLKSACIFRPARIIYQGFLMDAHLQITINLSIIQAYIWSDFGLGVSHMQQFLLYLTVSWNKKIHKYMER